VSAEGSYRSGFTLGVGAYLLWGFLPLYLLLLDPAGPVEVIAHRIVWSLVICLVVVLATRRHRELWAVLRSPRALGTLALASVLLTINWLVFVYSVSINRLAEASLGYFMNPLVSIALGVLLLHEQLRRTQWAAIGIAAVAVVVIGVAGGRFPWIAVVLALSFGFYGFVEKRAGETVSAVTALTVETLVVTPLALAFVGYLTARGQQHFIGYGAGQAWAMVGVGVATAAPLLLFNEAARRLPLSWVGLLQYLCPIFQFIIALAVMHEPMPAARWAGFALVWVALTLLVWEAVSTMRTNRKFAALA
jgi:chloramphenicol-sensitive protein RarD